MNQRFHLPAKMLGSSQADRAAEYNAGLSGEAAARALAVAIIRSCLAADRPELARVFLVEELTVDQARAALAAFDRPN